MKTAIIWRKSVYDSGRCPNCNTKLFGNNNKPINIMSDPIFGAGKLLCKTCGLWVAQLQEYDGPEEPGEKAGEWEGKLRP